MCGRARRLRGPRQRLGAARLDLRDTRGFKRSRAACRVGNGLAARWAESKSAQEALTPDDLIAP